mmetsp:Transcript_13356/g.21958  ORF Transcript_13356/g.21958 Transcript_13356/m.21958 type:complete len:109 (-) Transcript_13356:417-743(-)
MVVVQLAKVVSDFAIGDVVCTNCAIGDLVTTNSAIGSIPLLGLTDPRSTTPSEHATTCYQSLQRDKLFGKSKGRGSQSSSKRGRGGLVSKGHTPHFDEVVVFLDGEDM